MTGSSHYVLSLLLYGTSNCMVGELFFSLFCFRHYFFTSKGCFTLAIQEYCMLQEEFHFFVWYSEKDRIIESPIKWDKILRHVDLPYSITYYWSQRENNRDNIWKLYKWEHRNSFLLLIFFFNLGTFFSKKQQLVIDKRCRWYVLMPGQAPYCWW